MKILAQFNPAFATLSAALLLSACAVGPDYKKPEVSAPQQFRLQMAQAEASSIADLPWWSVFEDKSLQALVSEALANNHDLEVAVAHIERARNLVGVAKSEGAPQVGYELFGGGEKTVFGQRRDVGTVSTGFVGGVLNAAWELDLWGRIRHSTDSARANLLAQEAARHGVILTLVSDVAAGYFHLIELDRELAIAEESAGVYKKTLDLFTDRFHAGRDSELPVARAQAAYDSSFAEAADLKRLIQIQENALSVLVGAYPRDIMRGRGLVEQTLPQTPLGSTTDMLQRRPDIQQAEQTMIGANEEIGVAIANFYPKVGLSALLGGQAMGVTSDFGAFSIGNILADIAGPITTGGRLHSIYHERKAFWDETVAQYKKSVLIAFQETSDALAAQQNLVKRREGLTSQARALQDAVDLALLRYDSGRASYLEVLEAEQQLFPAQAALAQTQRDQLIAVVNLYKALGGGWSKTENVAQAEPASSSSHQSGG
jgi:multidrug efflux system outer membrane protein